ncbi:MAG TPA: hypothetical protein PKX48_10970 [Planctomycetota bacterium]|jgi:hypothetical protein|nr:hypothetical protein [Planctomycetota bacterium]OQC20656.1 MAG: hypothetical protein BWX69_01686 [Planctomycetes bacterium ADurb.Bin069]HNR98780.1 hypothetical protein [Planctomycetota bacterium]HNU25488.1 hypothetical protein [Planctomycetota bacterium]HOE30388.1 hypothetical protein [Planctomycetota bacterium]
MGGFENVKVRKARGAAGLAKEYDRAKPQGIGLGLTSWLDPRKLAGKKSKSAATTVGAGR